MATCRSLRLCFATLLCTTFLCIQFENVVSSLPSSRKVELLKKKNATEVFLNWLRQNDFTQVFPPKNKLSIYYPDAEGYERGLIAAVSMRSADVIARIPYSLGLELTDDDPLPFEDAEWTTGLAAKLLRELAKGDSSQWKPYLDLLPRNHPIPWLDLHPDEFAEIQYQPTIRRIADLQHEVIEEYKMCDPTVIANATWEQFGWAITLVWTHAFHFHVPSKAGGKGVTWRYMFLPVADLLNHDTEANTEWEKRGVGPHALELTATRYIHRGGALLADHGPITTEDMFLLHGFVAENNPRDSTVLFYNLPDVTLWNLRRFHNETGVPEREITEADLVPLLVAAKKGAARAMRNMGRPVMNSHLEPQYAHPHDGTHGNALMLLPNAAADTRLLGALAQMERELDEEEDGDPTDAEWTELVEDAFAILHKRCREMMDSYKTSLEEDLAFLRGAQVAQRTECDEENKNCHLVGEVSPAVELAVRFRIVKKKALQAFMDEHPTDSPPTTTHDEL